MQLCYRGAKYQARTNFVNSVESNINARFLGRIYTLRQTHHQTSLDSDLYKYRGIVYQK